MAADYKSSVVKPDDAFINYDNYALVEQDDKCHLILTDTNVYVKGERKDGLIDICISGDKVKSKKNVAHSYKLQYVGNTDGKYLLSKITKKSKTININLKQVNKNVKNAKEYNIKIKKSKIKTSKNVEIGDVNKSGRYIYYILSCSNDENAFYYYQKYDIKENKLLFSIEIKCDKYSFDADRDALYMYSYSDASFTRYSIHGGITGTYQLPEGEELISYDVNNDKIYYRNKNGVYRCDIRSGKSFEMIYDASQDEIFKADADNELNIVDMKVMDNEDFYLVVSSKESLTGEISKIMWYENDKIYANEVVTNQSEIEINSVNFPNEMLREKARSADKNMDGILSDEENKLITSVYIDNGDFSDYEGNITVNGIEHFKYLTHLTLMHMEEATELLDLSNKEQLEYVEILNTKVDVKFGKHDNLKRVMIEGANVKELDFSGCMNLSELIFTPQSPAVYSAKSKLDTVKISFGNPAALGSLEIRDVDKYDIDFTALTGLKSLALAGTKEKKINLANNTELEEIYLYDVAVKKLNLSKLRKLKRVYIYDSKINKIDFANNSVTYVRLEGNKKINKINLGKQKYLNKMYVNGGESLEITAKKCPKLTKLSLKNIKGLKKLPMKSFPNIKQLKMKKCK